MSASEVVFFLGDLATFSAIPALLLFVGFYFFRSPWRENVAGRALFYFTLSLAAVLISAVLLLIFGPDYFLREWVRLVLYGFISFTTWRLFYTLLKLQRRPKRSISQNRDDTSLASERENPNE